MKKLEEADLAKAESTPFVAPDREQEMLEIILTTGKAKDARLTDLLMKAGRKGSSSVKHSGT